MSASPPFPPTRPVGRTEDSPEADLFDFQVNGFAGVDFQRDEIGPEDFHRALLALRRHRVGSFFPTLITDEIGRLARRLDRLEAFRRADSLAASMIAGYHLEGPWLCPKPGYRGAHPAAPMHAPSLAELDDLQDAAGGNIRLVTLAPEWPGSPAFITALRAKGIHVALGHTEADDRAIDDAVAAGARFCTHLGNGVPSLLPRHDNVIQRLLARDELTACFIPDGIHVPPAALKNFVRAKPAGRVLFTTDCMAGAGAGPGRYTLGASEIEVCADGIARQPGGEGFAGSTLTPDRGVANIAAWLGYSSAEARRLWSDAAREAFGVPAPASATVSIS